MISHIEYARVKGQSLKTDISPVTLVTGENGSGKTSVLAAIQLALGQGVTDVGKSNQAIGLLLSSDTCVAEAATSEGRYVTTVSRKKSTVSVSQLPPIDKDLFGGVPQVVEEFFGMSGDDKWKLIMKAASKSKDIANLDAATRKKFSINDDDVVGSLMIAIENLKTKKKNLTSEVDAARARLSVSPPECDVENIQEVNKKVDEYRGAIKSHFASQQRASRRETNKASYLKEIESIERVIAECKIAVPTLKENLSQSKAKLAELVAYKESDEYKKRSEGVYILSQLRKIQEALYNINMNFPEFTDRLGKFESSIDELVMTVVEVENTDSPLDDNAIGNQERMVFKAETALARAESDMDVAVTKLAKLNEQLQSLTSEELVVLSEEELSRVSNEIVLLEKKQSDFTRLEQYNRNQKEDMEAVNKLASEIESINEQISKLNGVRERIIERTIPVIESKANQILRDVGLGEVIVKTEQTSSRVSLVIQDKDGVDMRTICRSRKVIYGAALLYAFHKICQVSMSVIYVEAAELSSNYLGKFLDSLCKNCEGTTFLVGHWARPETINPQVKVVELG